VELNKPGGHLILSTIARTPLARLLAIDFAESPLIRLAPAGSHTYSKFVLPSELESFFRDELQWTISTPSTAERSVPQGHLTPDQISPRHQLEARGTTYLPWKGEWSLLQKDHGGISAKLSKSVNFFFGARKPLLAPNV
jgi:2-polyprenyl-6-hydroxyphenyl methylase/3-demethylubiquinone-9 3-methyltransferase